MKWNGEWLDFLAERHLRFGEFNYFFAMDGRGRGREQRKIGLRFASTVGGGGGAAAVRPA